MDQLPNSPSEETTQVATAAQMKEWERKERPVARPVSREPLVGVDRKKSSPWGYIIGLVVAELLVVGLCLGDEHVKGFIPEDVELPLPFRSMVFCAVLAGILLTGVLILVVLLLQGVVWIFTKKRAGLVVSLARGFERCVKAAMVLGVTAAVICGTVWFLIPEKDRLPTTAYVQKKGDQAYRFVCPWAEDIAEDLIDRFDELTGEEKGAEGTGDLKEEDSSEE